MQWDLPEVSTTQVTAVTGVADPPAAAAFISIGATRQKAESPRVGRVSDQLEIPAMPAGPGLSRDVSTFVTRYIHTCATQIRPIGSTLHSDAEMNDEAEDIALEFYNNEASTR